MSFYKNDSERYSLGFVKSFFGVDKLSVNNSFFSRAEILALREEFISNGTLTVVENKQFDQLKQSAPSFITDLIVTDTIVGDNLHFVRPRDKEVFISESASNKLIGLTIDEASNNFGVEKYLLEIAIDYLGITTLPNGKLSHQGLMTLSSFLDKYIIANPSVAVAVVENNLSRTNLKHDVILLPSCLKVYSKTARTFKQALDDSYEFARVNNDKELSLAHACLYLMRNKVFGIADWAFMLEKAGEKQVPIKNLNQAISEIGDGKGHVAFWWNEDTRKECQEVVEITLFRRLVREMVAKKVISKFVVSSLYDNIQWRLTPVPHLTFDDCVELFRNYVFGTSVTHPARHYVSCDLYKEYLEKGEGRKSGLGLFRNFGGEAVLKNVNDPHITQLSDLKFLFSRYLLDSDIDKDFNAYIAKVNEKKLQKIMEIVYECYD